MSDVVMFGERPLTWNSNRIAFDYPVSLHKRSDLSPLGADSGSGTVLVITAKAFFSGNCVSRRKKMSSKNVNLDSIAGIKK